MTTETFYWIDFSILYTNMYTYIDMYIWACVYIFVPFYSHPSSDGLIASKTFLCVHLE